MQDNTALTFVEGTSESESPIGQTYTKLLTENLAITEEISTVMIPGSSTKKVLSMTGGLGSHVAIPSLTYTSIQMDVLVQKQTDTTSYVFDNRTTGTSYINSFAANNLDRNVNCTVFINNVNKNSPDGDFDLYPENQKFNLIIGTGTITSPITIFNRYSRDHYWMKGKIYSIKVWNNSTLVAHYDMSKGTLEDQTGNGYTATVVGGTFENEGGGQNFTVSLSDSVGTSESVGKASARYKSLNESVATSESFGSTTSRRKTFSESLAASEAFSKNSVKTLSDSQSTSEIISTSTTSIRTVNLTESLSVSEGVSRQSGKTRTEALATSDSLTKANVKTKTETIFNSDSATSIKNPATSTISGGYLFMPGSNGQYVGTPTLTFTSISMDILVEAQETYSSFVMDARTGAQALPYVSTIPGPERLDRNTNCSVVIDGVSKNSPDGDFQLYPDNQKFNIVISSAVVTSPITFFNRYTRDIYWMKGNIYRIKVFNGSTLVADYDMSTGTLQDQTGNGNHATMVGGQFAASGQTYSRTLTDTVGTSETFGMATSRKKTLSETVGTSESISMSASHFTSVTLTETVGLSEGFQKKSVKSRIDSVGISEIVGRTAKGYKTLNDSQGVSDRFSSQFVGASNPTIVTNGLVGYWNSKRGVDGTTWKNLAPSTVGQFDGTISGTTKQSDGMYFDNTDYVRVRSPLPDTPSSFTLEMRVKGKYTGSPDFLRLGTDSNVYSAYLLYPVSETNNWRVSVINTANGIPTVASFLDPNGITSNVEYLLTVTFDNFTKTLTFYRNGTNLGTRVLSSSVEYSFNGTGLYHKYYYLSTPEYPYTGVLDTFRLYNRALSESEVLHNYSFGPEVGLDITIDGGEFILEPTGGIRDGGDFTSPDPINTIDAGTFEEEGHGQVYTKLLSDAVSTSETFAKRSSRFKTFTETQVTTEQIQKRASKLTSESVSLPESFNKRRNKTVTETIATTETISIGGSRFIAIGLNETLTVSEVVRKQTSKPINESIGINESFGKTVAYSKTLNDSQGTSETFAKTAARRKSLSDSLGATDTLRKQMVKSRSDLSVLTDTYQSLFRSTFQSRTLSDGISIVEKIKQMIDGGTFTTIPDDGTVNGGTFELPPVIDGGVFEATPPAEPIDGGEFTTSADGEAIDGGVFIRIMTLLLKEELGLTEQPSKRSAIRKTETTSLADTSSDKAIRSFAEQVNMLDTLRKGSMSVIFTETIVISEGMSKRSAMRKTEISSLTDTSSEKPIRGLNETVSLSDSIAKQIRTTRAESLALFEIGRKEAKTSLNDSTNVNEVTLGGLNNTLSEQISLIEGFSKQMRKNRFDSANLFEMNGKRVGDTLQDNVMFLENLGRQIKRTIKDSVVTFEALNLADGNHIFLSDVVLTTDLIRKGSAIRRDESLLLAEDRRNAWNELFTEQIMITDSLSKQLIKVKQDLANLSETESIGKSQILADALDVLDSISKLKNTMVQEIVPLNEALNRNEGYTHFLVETVQLLDQLQKVTERQVRDSLFTNEIDKSLINKGLLEQVIVTDALITGIGQTIQIYDQVTLDDFTSQLQSKKLVERMSLLDHYSRVAAQSIRLRDAVISKEFFKPIIRITPQLLDKIYLRGEIDIYTYLQRRLNMAAENQWIKMFQGNTKIIVVDIEGIDDLTGSTLKWVVKENIMSGTPLIVKTLNNGIVIKDGKVEITLKDTDTTTMLGTFYHECELVDVKGQVSTIFTGDLAIRKKGIVTTLN